MKAIISKAARRKWAWVLALVMIVSIVIPTSLLTAKADVGTVKFIDGAAGWLESAYAQWTIDNQAEGYTAYIKKASQILPMQESTMNLSESIRTTTGLMQ